MSPQPRKVSWPVLLLLCLVVAVGAVAALLQFVPGVAEGVAGADSDDGSPSYSQIEDGLYMGGAIREAPPGATAALNLCEQEDVYKLPVHSWQPIPDAEPAPSLEWLAKQVAFIAEQRAAGRTVYVHCFAGISRAGLVVTAYYMREKHWTRDEALKFVRSRREIVSPNPAFMKLLLEWEKQVLTPA